MEEGGRLWMSPADGLPVDFPANRAIICRYSKDNGLAGAADVHDADTVAQLQTGVNSAKTKHSGEKCPGRFDLTYVIFTDGHRGQLLYIDVTDCFGWMMPSSYLLPGELARQIIALTPDGSGL